MSQRKRRPPGWVPGVEVAHQFAANERPDPTLDVDARLAAIVNLGEAALRGDLPFESAVGGMVALARRISTLLAHPTEMVS